MTQTHRFKVDKLIRDKLPNIMRESGIQLFERVMEKEEYVKRLKDKLLEEAREIISATAEKEIREELADLLEVMLAITQVYGIEFIDIQKTADQKRAEKGGFNSRIYSAFVEIEAKNPGLEYYTARPDQYPEIMQQPKDVKIIIRASIYSDVHAMVALSKAKRLSYERAKLEFWCYAGESGDEAQSKWFEELLKNKDYLMLTAEDQYQEILGFIIGKLVPAPPVYNPGGLTLMVDDFCVHSENLWETVGIQLMKAIKRDAKDKDATQIIVVCGAHDNPKRHFLMEQNLSIVSEWFGE
jgi:predicted house-cleaning noncanonical NTP pyrophosphatase (MazG superfamily)